MNPPKQDDEPRPDRPTRQRLAARINAIGLAVATARMQLRALAPHFPEDPNAVPRNLLLLHEQEADKLATYLIDFASAVRVGDVALDPRYLDDCRGKRPILDLADDAEQRAAPVDEKRATARKVVQAPAAKTPELPAPVDEKPASAPEVVHPPAAANGAAPVWASVPAASLNLPRSIQRQLVKAGLKTAGEINERWMTPPALALPAKDRGRVRAALDELIAGTEARRAAAIADCPPGVTLNGDGTIKEIVVDGIGHKAGQEIVFDANGTHTRPKKYTRQELGITLTLAELNELYSADKIAEGCGGRPSRIRGLVTVHGGRYAVTSGGSKEVMLTPVFPRAEWTGRTGSYDELVGPENGYCGVIVKYNRAEWVLGPPSMELRVVDGPGNRKPAAPAPAARPASTRRAPAPAPARPAAKPAAPQRGAGPEQPASPSDGNRESGVGSRKNGEPPDSRFPIPDSRLQGGWREMSVENLDLNGPQLAVLDGLGIKTAGELDDLLEGRTVKTYDKPGAIMLPVHGKPSSEWAEAVRAPLRAALALVKPTAAAEKPG